LNCPHDVPDFTGNDLWLQRKAFLFCVKKYGLEFILDNLNKIRFELIYYILLKTDMKLIDLSRLRKAVLSQNDRFAFPNLLLFHFNWTKQYDQYLQVGKWYKGFGNLANCGDPSEENSFVKTADINKIKHTCRLEQILPNQIYQKCFEEWNQQTSEGPDYQGFLNRLGYPDKINEFRQNTDKLQGATKEIKSTAITGNYHDLVLCFNA